MAQKHEVLIFQTSPIPNDFSMRCPQCGGFISNKTGWSNIHFKRYSDESVESIVKGELILAGQCLLLLCNDCLDELKDTIINNNNNNNNNDRK